MRLALKLLTCILPWPLRRRALQHFFGYQIHESARIGLAWIFPQRLVMEENSSIGDFTVAVHLDLIQLGRSSAICKGNWITGYPKKLTQFYTHDPDRSPELLVGEHSAITNRHLIDCTSRVTIGKFTTFAGFQSQILTHSIDIVENRQSSAPITIGDYCFVGTNCVLLGGSALPGRSVLCAKSLLNKSFTEEYTLYGGVPARPLKPLPREGAYFSRTMGMSG
jgi:acetyltransferase-like isoleucine patch superfamily enzyme